MSRRLLWALRLFALSLIALHLAAPRFSEATAWGLWPVTYLSPAARWVWGLTAAGLVLFGGRIWQMAGRLAAARLLRGRPLERRAFRLGFAVLCSLPFFVFRIRHLLWGDAKLLVVALDEPYRLTYVWQAPLDVFIHAKAWALGQALFGWPDPRPVYWILSALAGVAFVWILLELAWWLGHDRTERLLIAGLVLTLGLMQLFFGYVENYSLMTVGLLLYIWLALRVLRGEVGLIWPAMALAITHAVHPSTVFLAPTLVYLAWMTLRAATPDQRGRRTVRALRDIAAPYAVVFIGVVALMTAGGHGLDALLGVDFPGGGDRQWFVPLFKVTTEWQHYTMFSLGHLIDIINQQVLTAPVVWPSLLLGAAFAWKRWPREEPIFRFLLALTFCYLLLILTWNADYGGQKDWDLFSPAALPATLLLSYVLPRLLPERKALQEAGWALIAAQAFHAAVWIWRNTLPQ